MAIGMFKIMSGGFNGKVKKTLHKYKYMLKFKILHEDKEIVLRTI